MLDTGKTPPNLRMLEIFKVISENENMMTSADLTKALGWPKQSIHRLVSLLEEEGYMEKHGRFLVPSKRMMSLSSGLLQNRVIFDLRHQVLTDVSEMTGETVNLVMPEEDGMHYVDRVDTNWHFRISLPIGTHVPFHCTASGKTYMAYMRSDQRKKFIASLKMETFTAQTHSTTNTLQDELKEIKRQGFAMDNEEFYNDMVAVAVPVFDDLGRYCAALAFHGPKSRVTREFGLSFVPKLKEASERISSIMFGEAVH